MLLPNMKGQLKPVKRMQAKRLRVPEIFRALLLSCGIGFTPTLVQAQEGLRTFEPDVELQTEGGSSLHIYRSGGGGVVALRISFPLGESASEAGAGTLLRALAEDRMHMIARRIGARARVLRTPTALVYEVSGPDTELDFLVWILNEGIRPPDPMRFSEVRRDQLAELLRRQETPQGVLASRIRAAAGATGTVPLLGTVLSLERMDAGLLSMVWSRTHRRAGSRIVAVGDVPVEVLLASLADLSLPESGPEAVLALPTLPPEPRPRPEVNRHWVAEAWVLDEVRDPLALVAVAALGDRVRTSTGTYEIGVELWDVAGRWTLVVSGAAYPRNQAAMRTRVRGLLTETEAAFDDEGIRVLAGRIRADLMLQASTPWGFADAVGSALDAGRDPNELERLLEGLGRVDAQSLRGYLTRLAGRTPIRDEIRP